MYGLITLPVVPLRASDSERSEMISQLLFGEYVKIIDQHEKWLSVENLSDHYSGWVDKKMVTLVTEKDFTEAQQMRIARLFRTYNIIYNARLNQTKLIPGGSVVYDLQSDEFRIGKESWSLIEPDAVKENSFGVDQIVETALQYLNAPYLWGGKTVLGIDCSGLVQIVYAIGGFSLPRDASMQVEYGETISFLSEANAGDLAFFGNEEGGITHVGILTDNAKIIHASGWVKVESIDSQGIISSDTGEYTHYLRVIKRII